MRKRAIASVIVATACAVAAPRQAYASTGDLSAQYEKAQALEKKRKYADAATAYAEGAESACDELDRAWFERFNVAVARTRVANYEKTFDVFEIQAARLFVRGVIENEDFREHGDAALSEAQDLLKRIDRHLEDEKVGTDDSMPSRSCDFSRRGAPIAAVPEPPLYDSEPTDTSTDAGVVIEAPTMDDDRAPLDKRKLGIGLVAGGAFLMAGGAGVMVYGAMGETIAHNNGLENEPSGEQRDWYENDLPRGRTTAMAVGGAVAAVGIGVLIGGTIVLAKKARGDENDVASVRVSPALNGVTLSGRF